jgi:hypothetical protein
LWGWLIAGSQVTNLKKIDVKNKADEDGVNSAKSDDSFKSSALTKTC